MTDEVIFMLRMSAADLALLYTIASREDLTVNELILKLIRLSLRRCSQRAEIEGKGEVANANS